MLEHTSPALAADEIRTFICDGYIRLENAFSPETAAAARSILWQATGCDAANPATWSQPVIRLGQFDQPPFRDVARSPRLKSALDQLVGHGRWLPVLALGTFPIRFPSAADPGDAGWHIDPGFAYDDPDFMEWRTNVDSKGRALLMLFLFSDVGTDDAPTKIRVGSHRDIARQLAPAGEAGLTLRELAADGFAESAHRPETIATGKAGTVYLCHPFLVHSAQKHGGKVPRFMAQPPLIPHEPIRIERSDGAYSPVEEAIRIALLGGDQP